MEPSSEPDDERTAHVLVPSGPPFRQRRPAPEDEDEPSSRTRRKGYRDAGKRSGGAFWAVIAAVAVVGYVAVMALLSWRLSSELARDRQACTRNQPSSEDNPHLGSPLPQQGSTLPRLNMGSHEGCVTTRTEVRYFGPTYLLSRNSVGRSGPRD